MHKISNLHPMVRYVSVFLFIGCAVIFYENVLITRTEEPPKKDVQVSFTRTEEPSPQIEEPLLCEMRYKPQGTGPLPNGIISSTSDLEMRSLIGIPLSINGKGHEARAKSLLAMAVGIKQKEHVNEIVKKFPSDNFVIMLFHYDGIVDKWRDLQWSNNAVHISATDQTKWWFAKRFLHPDIVNEYSYIFLWDEDLGVEHFHPLRYLEIVEKEGLEISQPALDPTKSQVHHKITVRSGKGDVHRRFYGSIGARKCNETSNSPPCTGWVELMAPVFSRSSWRCAWHMIQNDLIHAWGLDMKFGYCAQGDQTKKVGVVDSEFIDHKGLLTLGGPDGKGPLVNRLQVRERSYWELQTFRRRWNKAVEEDKCWTDPYQ